MARNEITFLVNARKNMNNASKTYGQFYPEAEPKVPISLKGFARHFLPTAFRRLSLIRSRSLRKLRSEK